MIEGGMEREGGGGEAARLKSTRSWSRKPVSWSSSPFSVVAPLPLIPNLYKSTFRLHGFRNRNRAGDISLHLSQKEVDLFSTRPNSHRRVRGKHSSWFGNRHEYITCCRITLVNRRNRVGSTFNRIWFAVSIANTGCRNYPVKERNRIDETLRNITVF